MKTIPGLSGDFSPVTAAFLTELLNLIDGMLSGDEAVADESIRRLYELADENAKTLAQLNPYWDEEKWRNLFYRYNRDLVTEVIAVKSGDYTQALKVFETLIGVSQEIGDYYAEGLIHFLPEDQPQIPIAYFNMIKDLRSIGTERAYLTRFYMVAKIVELFDENLVTESFFALISRMRDKFELILGTEIAYELENFLSQYVIKIEAIIDAVLSGDTTGMEAPIREVEEFINTFSAYLGSINPYWDETKWKELFNQTATLIIEQSLNLQKAEYNEALQNFERFIYSTYAIDDYFAYGLYQYMQTPTV